MNISMLSFITKDKQFLCSHEISYLLLVKVNSSEFSSRKAKMHAVIFFSLRFNKTNLLVRSTAKTMSLTLCSGNNQEDIYNGVLSLQSYYMLTLKHDIMCSYFSLKHRTWTCGVREIAKCLQRSEIWQKIVM